MPAGDCKQEAPIASLTEAVKSLTSLQAETVEALKMLAAQNERMLAIAARQDKLEAHIDNNLEEIYPRLRAVEEKGIRHDAFVEQHERQDEKDSTLSTYIKGGITVSSILAIGAFLLYLYAHSGYATRDEHPEVEKVEKAQRR